MVNSKIRCAEVFFQSAFMRLARHGQKDGLRRPAVLTQRPSGRVGVGARAAGISRLALQNVTGEVRSWQLDRSPRLHPTAISISPSDKGTLIS